MRSPRYLQLALIGLAGLGVADGLAVGSDHACVLLDDGSVKVRKPRGPYHDEVPLALLLCCGPCVVAAEY